MSKSTIGDLVDVASDFKFVLLQSFVDLLTNSTSNHDTISNIIVAGFIFSILLDVNNMCITELYKTCNTTKNYGSESFIAPPP